MFNSRFKSFLSEGLIKLPQKMFFEGVKKIVEDALSFNHTVVKRTTHTGSTEIQAKTTEKFLITINKVAEKYGASLRPLLLKKRSLYKIKVDLSDLPDRYKKHVNVTLLDPQLTVLWDSSSLSKANAAATYTNTESGKISVSIFSLTNDSWLKTLAELLRNSDDATFKSEIETRIESIISSFEHEMTHYIQFKVFELVDARQTQAADKEIELSIGKKDAYYQSNVEFDPHIKTSLGVYRAGEKSNLDFGIKGSRDKWIKEFVGAKPVKKTGNDLLDEIENGFIKPSRFFLSLKDHDRKKWEKAVKLFIQEVERRFT